MIKPIKHSRQRDCILDVLKNTNTHPTADWIYTKVKEQIPNISLGTVYRNLSLLCEHQMVLKLNIGNGVVHYDARITPHYHLYCKICGKILDLPAEYHYHLDTIASYHSNHRIDSHTILFYGVCDTCLKKKKIHIKSKTLEE